MINLFPHQIKALKETEAYNRAAYYLDMGLGKTFVGSEKAVSFSCPILVICQKSKVNDWVDHFREFYPLPVFDLTDKKQFAAYQEITIKNVGVINYDLVYRRPYFAHMTGYTLMLDESSIIQNEKSKRAKYILKMQPDNVILLSGTPTAGKYERLWTQLHLLGWPISKTLYYNQYVIQDWIEDGESGFKIPVITGYKNVERLRAKLAQHGAIFMKSSEAFDLPPQVESVIKVPATEEYRKFMKTDYLPDIEGHELIGDTTLTKRLYARQLCGQYHARKLDAFRELVESTEDRLIVFYNFNAELDRLRDIAIACERHISVVNGDIKDLAAYEAYPDSVTFIQYQAGAMGLNLQKANKIVYFTLTDKSELFEQSKKRIHRIGQEQTCFYYYLICPGSVEERIQVALKLRKDYTDALFEKDYKEEKR